MNERIRELAQQAADGMLSYDAEGEWRLNQKEAEKFALLIVGECAYVMDEDADHPFVSRGSILKHHFGLEK